MSLRAIEFPQSTHIRLAQPKSEATGVRFAGVLDHGAEWIVKNLYDRGEGFRYAVEQTIGYTIPRTAQQYNRTRHITGEGNKMAAQEMLIRDLAADVMDTFMPGLLATHFIGRAIDKTSGTVLKNNLDYDALKFYHTLTKNGGGLPASRSHFIRGVETALQQFMAQPGHALQSVSKPTIQLDQAITAVQKGADSHKIALGLAERLGLKSLDVKLAHKGQRWEGHMGDMLSDLASLTSRPNAAAYEGTWGKQLAGVITRTASAKKYQMLANVAALVGSISIPFVVRAITKSVYGKDAFPGSKEIEDFFGGDSKKRPHPHAEAENGKPHKKGLHWFPFLKETLAEGKVLPTALSIGFFGILGAAVYRRFHISKLNPLKMKDWFKVYQFDRGFPYTTVTQMELTYGLLCGTRLASSRNDAEFRETLVRDCALGWPTLTYFFEFFREKVLAPRFNQNLAQKFKSPNLLLKADGGFRRRVEITPLMVKNLGLTGRAAKAATVAARRTNAQITLLSALTSWVLLAWAEPQVGIMITNRLEMDKHTKSRANGHAKTTAPQHA